MSYMKNLRQELVESIAMGLNDEQIARITGLPTMAVTILVNQIEQEQMAEDLAQGYAEYYGA